jgi:isopenicillin N synthase-like dioxygenase
MSSFASRADSLSIHRYPTCLDQNNAPFWDELREHGCAVIVIPASGVTPTASTALGISADEVSNILRSQQLLNDAFLLPSEKKEKLPKYHMEKGLNYGYRIDDNKEFLETRIRYTFSEKCASCEGVASTNVSGECASAACSLQRTPDPKIPIEDYTAVVDKMFKTLSKISIDLLRGLASRIGLHCDTFVSLTDLYDHLADGSDGGKDAKCLYSAPPTAGSISASLLRICRYPNNVTTAERDGNTDNEITACLNFGHEVDSIQFGAHTDTSFLTLGVVSKTPGLEILRKSMPHSPLIPESQISGQSDEWFPIELYANRHSGASSGDVMVVVFLGELLHMVTRGVYSACVHRVVSYKGAVGIGSPDRISCPFIVRGKLAAEVKWRDPLVFQHPGGSAALEDLPDFDGLNMKLLHKFLDIKRAKCVESNNRNNSNSGDSGAPPAQTEWILQSSLKSK